MKPNRRKFLKGFAMATGAALLSQCTPSTHSSDKQSSSTSKPERKGLRNKKFDAIVVGAGLSGLNAAMILEEAGLEVLVLEGRKRLGGRVYTLMDVPGKPEAAGEYIGANYARMINRIKTLGLKMYNPDTGGGIDRPWLYQIQDQFIDAKSWESHALNPLSGEDRKILPHRFLSRISNKNNPLKDKPLNAWLTPEFEKFDIPHDQYLRSLGVNEETIKLMNVVIHSGGIHNTSALNELRRYHVMDFNSKLSFADGKSWKMVEGGNSLLPQAMADSLTHEPITGKTVVGFREKGGVVEVHCADGTEYRANNVVCSIPISVLRNVVFEPFTKGILSEAIDQIDYGLSVQAHFLIKEKFWEKDGLDANMWTDGPLERFAVRSKQNETDPDAAVVFINGPESLKFRLMTDEQVFDYVEKKLADIRPSTKGVLERLVIQSCERDIHGAGDWVYWQPGQVKKFGNHMRTNHGRIHFCGEHTAIMERGMEGAMESGERAAMDIILNG